MKIIRSGTFNICRVHQSIIDSIGNVFSKEELPGIFIDTLIISGNDRFISVTFPDNPEHEKIINGILDKHDPTKKTKKEEDDEKAKITKGALQKSCRTKLEALGFTNDEANFLVHNGT
jgi:hypothetical protein